MSSLQLPAADQVAGLLRRLLDDGRCLVLLDGLDEVIDDGARVDVSNAIGQFAAVFRDRNADADAPGNSFVVTSRIAGYRPFITLPADFSEYTIRPLRGKQIERFLDRWCHAVERQLQEGAETEQIDEDAARERDLVLDAISRSPGVRRLSENPLLLRILAMLHRSTGHLPQRRVEIYEEAADMLLYLWHLGERRTPKAAIDKYLALQLLGPVAMEIHTRWPSGFMSLGETEKLLCRLRGPRARGTAGAPLDRPGSPENPQDGPRAQRPVRGAGQRPVRFHAPDLPGILRRQIPRQLSRQGTRRDQGQAAPAALAGTYLARGLCRHRSVHTRHRGVPQGDPGRSQ